MFSRGSWTINNLWLTLSKALEKPRKIQSACKFLSSIACREWVKSSSCISHENDQQKPCWAGGKKKLKSRKLKMWVWVPWLYREYLLRKWVDNLKVTVCYQFHAMEPPFQFSILKVKCWNREIAGKVCQENEWIHFSLCYKFFS